MNSPAVDVIGRTIAGRYRLLRLVGEGGVGRVYEAEQILGSSQRAVAVKLLRPEWSQDAAVVARFQREAALVARLQHPNTVRIYDFGATEDGTLFLAMEFLRGRSLQQLLDAEGALAPERVRHIIRQVAGSLQEAHDQGIVHRDLKPDNILIQGEQSAGGSGAEPDTVKLVDFGIAKGQASSGSAYTKLTALGTFVGTPAYMSPEQFGGGNVGPASDVYSLGVTSHYMLSGRLPFSGETAVQWAQAHLSTPPPLLEQDAGKGPIPESMRQAVARALSKDPAQRPSSAAQFVSEFSGGAVAVAVAPAVVAGGAVAGGAAAAVPVAVPPPTAAQPAALPAGGPHTAPMTRVPDFAALREGSAVATTVSIPAPPPPVVSPHIPASVPPRTESRRMLWLIPLLAGVAAGGFALFQYSGQRIGFWPATAEPVSPEALSQLGVGGRGEPAPVVIEPDPIPASPPPTAPRAVPKPAPPVARNPSPPKPAPGGSTPAPVPSLPVPLPGVTPLPGAGGAPGSLPGAPAPTTSPAPSIPGLPGLSLPFPLPSQGSCQRCLDALEAGGHASVVNAMAQDLLCDDQAARLRCETRVREVAPDVAEQAARAGDCPSALATMAAAVHLGVDPMRFSAVNAACVR